jgi:hypothetical protein
MAACRENALVAAKETFEFHVNKRALPLNDNDMVAVEQDAMKAACEKFTSLHCGLLDPGLDKVKSVADDLMSALAVNRDAFNKRNAVAAHELCRDNFCAKKLLRLLDKMVSAPSYGGCKKETRLSGAAA